MMHAFASLVWLSLAANQPGAGIPDNLPETQTQDEVIEATSERYERMTVPVTIEGQGPFRFMIDTGAEATVITRGMEERLQLQHAGTAMLVGMASVQQVELFDVDRLELGSRMIDNIQAPLLERQNIGADGIVGLDVLQDLRVLIDFRDNSIAVADAGERTSNKGFDIVVRAKRRDGQLLITDAMIDGIRTAVIIDTGAQGSLGNMALRRKLRTRYEGKAVSTDVHGTQLMSDLALVDRLDIDGLSLTNLAVTFADTPAFDALGLNDRPALSLGMWHLKMFERVAIDFSKRRVLFDLPKSGGRKPLREIFPPQG